MAKHVITPVWQTQRGSVVRASGCAVGVPVAGAKVFGETRQNLWTNPSGTNNGVTVTSNSDGSMTLSGTATSAASVSSAGSYIIKPSTAYTFSMDAALTGASFVVTEYDAAGSQLAQHSVSSTSAAPFTSSASVARCVMSLSVQSGQTVSGTYRVMLNEGSEAQPWCPPGLSSVSEPSVVSAGKNLLKIDSDLQTKTVSGLTFTPNEDGTVTVNGTAAGTSDYYLLGTSWDVRADNYLPVQEMVFSSNGAAKLYGFDSSGSTSFGLVVNGGNQIISAEQIIKAEKIICYLSYKSGQGETNKKVYAQLELGSQATAYEPTAVSTNTVDLAGHELRSLPDGTRDVLTVDGSGAVVVEPWCYDFVLTGEESWIKSEARENSFYIISPGLPGFAIGSPSDSFVLCDKLPVVGTLAEYEQSTYSVLLYEAASLNIRHTASTLEEFKSWLASNNIHVVVAARAPFDAVPLDPIAPPTVPADDAALWAASDVPCELEATTWTASGAEQGRQQAAMVALAQQVRQQAETVAALAAQSLEA